MEDRSKGRALNALGDTYRHLLKDDDRAVEAYRRVYSTRNVYKHCQAAVAVANIRARQKKFDEAIRELSRIDMDRVKSPYWQGAMLCAHGGVLAGAGRKAQAIGKYNEALLVKGLTAWHKRICEQALKKLRGGAE